jgi:hypothetical protein
METAHWINSVDDITKAFTKDFGHLSSRQLNFRPTPSAWSIAQNIEHLIVINETYYPVIHSVRTDSYQVPWIGKLKFLVKFFGKTILKSVQPDRKKKMKTFPLWEPSKSDIKGDIVDRFARHQEELKNIIAASSDLLDKGTIISSPANRNIVYTLSDAFEIIIAHERRHLEQAREVLRSVREQKTV